MNRRLVYEIIFLRHIWQIQSLMLNFSVVLKKKNDLHSIDFYFHFAFSMLWFKKGENSVLSDGISNTVSRSMVQKDRPRTENILERTVTLS